jgi:hypothetical protein
MDEFEKEDLLKQIKNDTHFLRKHFIMDYSLFVKIENVGEDQEDSNLSMNETLIHRNRAVSFSNKNLLGTNFNPVSNN